MRVLIVVPDLALGGVTTVVKNLVNKLNNSKYKILIVSLKPTSIKEFHQCKVRNLNINNKFNYFLSIGKLNIIIREFKPNIIHSHTVYSHLIIRFIKILKLSSFIHICSEHNTLSAKDINKTWILFKITNKYSDLITFVSQYSINSYIENGLVSGNKVKLLYNGVNFNIFDNHNKFSENINGYNFAYIGRLSKEKNLFNLLKAILLIKKNLNDFKLCIVGEGDQEDELKKFVNDNGLSDNVDFLGHKNNVIPIMKNIDLLILSSDTEGLPMVILEAMAMQCNVVSTECGGIPEIFTGIPSFLAKINDPEDLASKILDNINLSKEERKEIGVLYKKQVINKFSIDKYASELEKIYKSLIN
jgi:glycosyltransferase involved in cell wall biosynthesis